MRPRYPFSRSGSAVRAAVESEPPPIPGVRRVFVTARGVRFHVTEAGPADGRPVLVLHGWPEHHYAYRHLLADPPAGLRIIAPDLPGYGWSGPPPHRWAKDEVAADLLALLDALGLDRVLLVGHDWGAWISFRLALPTPERFDGLLALNMAHPWNTPRTMLPHAWRFLLYQPAIAAFGMYLHQHTQFLERLVFANGIHHREEFGPEVIGTYVERFRDPVCARAATDTYRTFWLRELPRASSGKSPRGTIPIRMIFGTDDAAIHYGLAAAETADADDYTVELVADSGHFVAEERPDLIRARLLELAAATAPPDRTD